MQATMQGVMESCQPSALLLAASDAMHIRPMRSTFVPSIAVSRAYCQIG